jgi:predicted SprT family Zn-dependent metalloprotease
MNPKPSIFAIVSERVELRRAGRQYRGLCPFHPERTPSFHVDENRQRYKCFGCGESGDVVDFIMKSDALTFREAMRALGVTADRKPQRPLTPARKRAAETAAAWVNEQRAKFNAMIVDAMEQRHLADEIGDSELAESFDREFVMLRGFYDTLEHPRPAAEMIALKNGIEAITEYVEIVHNQPAPFPALTSKYRNTLANNPLTFEDCFK